MTTDQQAHTPGPWEWREHYGDHGGTFLTLEAPNGTVINGESGADVSDEDAALVAAAPDLLAALDNLLNCVDGIHDPEMYSRCKRDALAAISKATSA